MVRKLRYYYRLYRLKQLLKSIPTASIVLTSCNPSVSAPVQIAFNGKVQLCVILDDSSIHVYIHERRAIPFIVAHLVLLVNKIAPVKLRGIYNDLEIMVDRPTKGKPQLTLVKE
jgi:hypothetical protein